MSQVGFVNQENLKIARENMGLDTATASKHISASEDDVVQKFEEGNVLPTWSQISKLAKLYNISELMFFSKSKITKHKAVPDYRVSSNKKNDVMVKKLVNLVITRQRWLESVLKEEGYSRNRLLGSGKSISSPEELARFMSDKLELNISEIKEISTRKQVLSYLIQKAEDKGLFIGKTISYIKLPVEDMRGVFVANEYCPFIVINRSDALSGQIFSLVHEFAHFFRKSDAISNSLDFRSSNGPVDPEEVFCNKVAAELLLPKSEFTKWTYSKNDIIEISDLYKVSPIFVFYRLKDLGKILKDVEAQLEREIRSETERNLKLKEEREKAKKGGNYTNSMRDSNGKLFNRVVEHAYLENRIGYVEAANILRFSPEKA